MPKTAIVRIEQREVELLDRARKFIASAKSANTLRAYEAGWRDFAEFCKGRKLAHLPATAETVALYLTLLSEGQNVSTLQVKLAAISFYHRTAKKPDPAADSQVRILMQGIRRECGTAPVKKSPLTLDELRPLLRALPRDLKGKRDRAILLIGYAGAFRRSELCALNVVDLTFASKLTIRVRRSKTDQEGKGMVKVIPRQAGALCPVTALSTWLSEAQIEQGPVFRTLDRWGNVRDRRLNGNTIALIVKEAALRAGMDPDLFAGHSLRSGFITATAMAGVESRDIMAQTGHKSETVMRGYIQDAGLGATAAVNAAFGQKKTEGKA